MEQFITGPGTITVNYNVSFTDMSGAPVVDQFMADNSASYSVNVTDNVYCKGRYDMVHNRPFCTTYLDAGPSTAGGSNYDDYMWGPMFYVRQGRYIDSATFSLVVSRSGGDTDRSIPSGQSVMIYLFQWVDGSGSGASAYDGYMQNEELTLAGIATKTFATGDYSFNYYSAVFTDSLGGNAGHIKMNDDSWYWVSADMPQNGGTTTWAIGCDGFNNAFPRMYGRSVFPDSTLANPYIEYYAPIWALGNRGGTGGEGTTMLSAYNYWDQIVLFGGTLFDSSIDSTIFANTKGFIPNISITTQMWPTETKEVLPNVNLNIYPVPANNMINVSLGLQSPAKKVTYKIITTTGHCVATEVHENVSSEVYSYNTERLADGVYYMIVLADNRPMYRKFTVVH
jgi:hypothetical protein